MGSSPPDCSCRGETQDKRPKTARRSPPCPPESLFLTSARPTLRTSRRRRSTDTSCSTSRRRRVLWSSLWETVTRPMTTTSTTYRREVTESAGVSGGTFPLLLQGNFLPQDNFLSQDN